MRPSIIADDIGLFIEAIAAFQGGTLPPAACRTIRDSELCVDFAAASPCDWFTALTWAGVWCFGKEWEYALEKWGVNALALLAACSLAHEQERVWCLPEVAWLRVRM